MRNNKSKLIKYIIITLFILIGLVYLSENQSNNSMIIDNQNNKQTNDEYINKEILGNKDDLISFSIDPGTSISGVLEINGSVKSVYFFEGNILIGLLDSNKNILVEGYGTATSDWMTEKPITFSSTIDSTGLIGNGYILIRQDNPSDREGGEIKEIFIPVTFN